MSEHGPQEVGGKGMNPSDGCATGSYPPATKKEKYISDVRCTCPYCVNSLT